MDNKEPHPEICFALVDDDIAILRVVGRGTFQNSAALEKLEQEFAQQEKPVRYILDLQRCNYMDSTFMGVLAHVGLSQTDRGRGRMTVVNANNHTVKLLSTLGLTNIVELHEQAHDYDLDEQDFETTRPPIVDKYQQIVHMMAAHQKLIDLDSANEIRFENVMKVLSESLGRESAPSERQDPTEEPED